MEDTIGYVQWMCAPLKRVIELTHFHKYTKSSSHSNKNVQFCLQQHVEQTQCGIKQIKLAVITIVKKSMRCA